jgi:hypothetical protein
MRDANRCRHQPGSTSRRICSHRHSCYPGHRNHCSTHWPDPAIRLFGAPNRVIVLPGVSIRARGVAHKVLAGSPTPFCASPRSCAGQTMTAPRVMARARLCRWLLWTSFSPRPIRPLRGFPMVPDPGASAQVLQGQALGLRLRRAAFALKRSGSGPASPLAPFGRHGNRHRGG